MTGRERVHAGFMSFWGTSLRVRLWESIDEPKIDLAQETTSLKLMFSIACLYFARL